jgi:hypothetical protein
MRYLGHPSILPRLLSRMGPLHVASTTTVRRWLRNDGLDLQGYEVDHIVPRSLGGVDHPHNYALVPRSLNRQWAGNWTAAKRHELGTATVRQALDFAQWGAAQSTVPYGAFVVVPRTTPDASSHP